jgi:hypothetical protein
VRRRNLISMALVVTPAIALAPAAGVSAKSRTVTKLSCTIEAFQHGVPNPNAIQLGFVSCPKPLGKGLHYSAFTVTSKPAPGVPGAASGTFRNHFNRGTTSGTFELTIAASSPTNLTYTGTVTYTGGTGRFKHIKGGGTILCTTTDGGARKLCEVNATLTGI